MAQTPESALEGWLRGTGFPLEFAVARAFAKRGFQVHRGVHIVDEALGKALEVDVLASLVEKGNRNIQGVVDLWVECKHVDDEKPWALFEGTNGLTALDRAQWLHGDPLGRLAMFDVAGDPARARDVERLSFCTAAPVMAYGGTSHAKDETTTGKPNAVYAALNDITTRVALRARHEQPDPHFVPTARLFMPVVVVSGNLYAASYDEAADKIAVRSVDHVRVEWMGSARTDYIVIDVVTRAGLDAFVERSINDACLLARFLANAAEELLRLRDGPAEALRARLMSRSAGLPFSWPQLGDDWLNRAEGGAMMP